MITFKSSKKHPEIKGIFYKDAYVGNMSQYEDKFYVVSVLDCIFKNPLDPTEEEIEKAKRAVKIYKSKQAALIHLILTYRVLKPA